MRNAGNNVYQNGDVVKHRASGKIAVVVNRKDDGTYTVTTDFSDEPMGALCCEMDLLRRANQRNSEPPFHDVFHGRIAKAFQLSGINSWEALNKLSRRDLEVMPRIGSSAIRIINEELIRNGFDPK